MTGPLRTSIMFPANSAHTVIAPNKVVELRSSSVVLEKPFEGSTTVAFFVSPIFHSGVSMGSDRAPEMYPRYWSAEPSPMRPAPGSTEKEYLNALKKQQSDISRSESVLIVGAGAVGLEFSGMSPDYTYNALSRVNNLS